MRILMALVLFFGFSKVAMAASGPSVSDRMQDVGDWPSFEKVIEQNREEDRTIGVSYLISGGLVTLGGIAGVNTAGDDTSKFVFGLSQSLGIAGIGYGIAKLTTGNEYDSFYEALQSTKLSPEQRNRLVQVFLEREKARHDSQRRVKMITHLLLSAVNFYAASQTTDSNAKTFLQFFGGANLALATVYTF